VAWAPDEPFAYYNAGKVAAILHHCDRAHTWLEAFLRLSPQAPQAGAAKETLQACPGKPDAQVETYAVIQVQLSPLKSLTIDSQTVGVLDIQQKWVVATGSHILAWSFGLQGQHHKDISLNAGEVFNLVIDYKKMGLTELAVSPRSKGPLGQHGATWALIGGGAALLVAAIISDIQLNGTNYSLDKNGLSTQRETELQKRFASQRTASRIFWSTGIISAVAGLLLLDRPKDKP
jgi:hypothetical protein